ncbi:hypothetical protein [Paraclostridium bifermentans]|uniref:hypothetical protein n=1 Tax=Paraclostridium bifermentans TaxID=1490 RepID=UPI00242F18FE|nr:hypothetical protein [Paraclostridium bifermentans]
MRECFGRYPNGEFPCMFCENKDRCKEVNVKKKVVITFKDKGELIYKGYRDKNDDYFINKFKDDEQIMRITRQYYPLKNNDVAIIYENK